MRSDQIEELAAILRARLQESCAISDRLLVGIAGAPGSGKSVFGGRIVDALGEQAALIGLDGWHYTRAQLDRFKDPAEAHRRRGAAFTFAAEAYTAWLRQLRAGGSAKAPAFKHEVKDPEPDAISVGDARIVVIEGLYVLRTDERWAAATAMLDERWLLVTDEQTVVQRLIARHVRSGICENEETARERALHSDLPNWRETVNATPNLVIEDVQDLSLGRGS